MTFTIGSLGASGTTMPPSFHTGALLHDSERKRQARIAQLEARTIIAWDGEGIKLSGDKKPQHYVLFGSSATVDSPLVIDKPDGRLTFVELADYMLRVAKANPKAFHVGYFFEYDQNMIIWSLPWRVKQRLYETGAARYNHGGCQYRIRIVFGKKIRITRFNTDKTSQSVMIEDIGSYFATSFVKAYQSMFPDYTDDPNWSVVVEGKKMRSDTQWEDLADITTYWKAEIVALARLANQFKRIMYNAGFYTYEWYGPGALANYIRRNNGLVEHEWGGKEVNLPEMVHHASKAAYFGGHVEQYKCGRIVGPIWVWDVNSAYPAAFCEIPSLAAGGSWEHLPGERTIDDSSGFSIHRIKFHIDRPRMMERQAMPLPHRDSHALITYPPILDGWYWRPEAWLASNVFPQAVTVVDSWRWNPGNDLRPWDAVLYPMYQKRLALKRSGDPTQMAFKLGPNSLYGKMAQRAGWDKDKCIPPRSHTLPVAGYVTSFCRKEIMKIVYSCKPGTVIAVETDGVFTTTPPDEMRNKFTIGTGLGEWSVKRYDEMLFIQNGLYMAREGDKWTVLKTRGVNRSVFLSDTGSIQPDVLEKYLASCHPGEQWEPTLCDAGERFIGLGAAISRSTKLVDGKNMGVNPFKASKLHCQWFRDEREIDLRGKGKRIHVPKLCQACRKGLTANDGAHDLLVRSHSMLEPISAEYMLPWEKGYEEPEWLRMDLAAAALIGRSRV